MNKPLDHGQMTGLARLLISLGVTITQKASTVSMVTDSKGKLNVVRVQGWLSVTDEELTPDIQGAIDSYLVAL